MLDDRWRRRSGALLRLDEGRDSFAEHRIWYTYHRGVRYSRILEQCALPVVMFGSQDNAASAREIVPRHVVEKRWARLRSRC